MIYGDDFTLELEGLARKSKEDSFPQGVQLRTGSDKGILGNRDFHRSCLGAKSDTRASNGLAMAFLYIVAYVTQTLAEGYPPAISLCPWQEKHMQRKQAVQIGNLGDSQFSASKWI